MGFRAKREPIPEAWFGNEVTMKPDANERYSDKFVAHNATRLLKLKADLEAYRASAASDGRQD